MPTPSDPGRFLGDFIGLRDSVRETRIGHGGHEVCSALTHSLDLAVERLVPSIDEVAVIALGGYGRGELSPYSDVDLMLLHEVDDASDLAADLFRPLWDAKLNVGHSVRTVRDAAAAARERFDTQTTLLTARLITGSEELFALLMDEVARVTKARPLRRHLVEAERARRMETQFPKMAVDLKTGRGGMRALQAFEWERRREELIGRFSTATQPVEDRSREVILQVRNGLHAVTGRRHDVFNPELRVPVAEWLGQDVFEVATELVAAMQSIDRLAERKWPEVLEERQPRLGRRVWASFTGSRGALHSDATPDEDDLDLILRSGEQGRATFDRLWELGHLNRLLPEWGVVANLPQLEPFHEHPVAAHLWRTVAEMQEIVGGDDAYGRIAAELGQPELLRLAAFLHDIGKGHGGDHSVIGADIVARFVDRLELDPEYGRLLSESVRLHLLLPMTATRRDLDDPAVIEEVATEVGGLELLRVLYLLTVADSRATGPSMWSEWKATLLRILYLRCGGYLEAREPAAVGATREDVLSLADAGSAAAADHMDGMPEEYLRSVTATDVIWHLELIESLEGASNVGARIDRPVGTAVVVGVGRPRFRQTVAAVFAAHGIDVLEARLGSRSDGVVVDRFRVRDDRTGGPVPDERWDRVRTDLEDGLNGVLDTGSKLATRAAAYPAGGNLLNPSAEVSTDAASGDLVVVVKCSDRIGRLAEILTVLDDCGLDIRLAKLDSREGEVIDTFHIGSGSGGSTELDGLGERIAAGLTP